MKATRCWRPRWCPHCRPGVNVFPNGSGQKKAVVLKSESGSSLLTSTLHLRCSSFSVVRTSNPLSLFPPSSSLLQSSVIHAKAVPTNERCITSLPSTFTLKSICSFTRLDKREELVSVPIFPTSGRTHPAICQYASFTCTPMFWRLGVYLS